jgi:hypothetical protein
VVVFWLLANVLENFSYDFMAFSRKPDDRAGRRVEAVIGKCLFIEYGLMVNCGAT